MITAAPSSGVRTPSIFEGRAGRYKKISTGAEAIEEDESEIGERVKVILRSPRKNKRTVVVERGLHVSRTTSIDLELWVERGEFLTVLHCDHIDGGLPITTERYRTVQINFEDRCEGNENIRRGITNKHRVLERRRTSERPNGRGYIHDSWRR